MSNAAAAVASELIAEAGADGGLEDVEQPEVEAVGEEETPEAEAEESFDEQGLPEEIEALLAEDDPEPDPEEDLEPAAEWDEFGGDETEKLRIQAHKAEKRAAALEKQMLAGQRKEWAEEIKTHFRYASPTIAQTASSRRDAIRQAKAEHDLGLRGAEAVKAHYEANIEKIVAARLEEAEAQVKASWGTPIDGPGGVPAAQVERGSERAKIENAATLKDRLLAKIQAGTLDV